MSRKTHFAAFSAFLSCSTLLLAGLVYGENVPVSNRRVAVSNVSNHFASMQAEIDQLRAEVNRLSTTRFSTVSYQNASAMGCDSHASGGCDSCGASCDSSCLCNVACGGFYGGIEAVIAKPYFQHETDTIGLFGPPQPFDPEFDFAASPRIFLGWRNECGAGIRARYWYYDHISSTLQNFPGIVLNPDFYNMRLKTQALDVEYTQAVSWGRLNSNIAVGVRYASVENRLRGFNDAALTQLVGTFGTLTEGFGPTIAAENKLGLGCTNLSVVGNLRASMLFGESTYSFGGPGGGLISDGSDDVVGIAEIQAGIEWQRETRFGLLSAYGLLEAQYWAGATANVPLDASIFPIGGFLGGYTTDQDLGFFGATFGIQLMR